MQRFESKYRFGFSATDFYNWRFGPENIPGLSRNGPHVQSLVDFRSSRISFSL